MRCPAVCVVLLGAGSHHVRHRKPRANRLQFVPVQASKLVQALFACHRQMNLDAPLVSLTRGALHPARSFAPGYQRHDAMMFGLQALGEFRHRRPFPSGEALDLQHQQVLQWRHPVALRHFFAETQKAAQLVAKLSRIARAEASDALFSPEDSAALFGRHSGWLDDRLAVAHDGPTVVITHHAPSPKSIHPRFAGSLVNACFVSDAEHLVGADRAQLWIHGHTHDSFDYVVNGCRIVCNPRGYAKAGVNENPRFDPDLMVEVG